MQQRIVIVIPTYNNARTVTSVIDGAKTSGLPVIVVNDGSTDATGEILKPVQGIEVITFSVNRGKGAALRSAFEHALTAGYTHAITIDADGQHLAADIALFIDKINEFHPVTECPGCCHHGILQYQVFYIYFQVYHVNCFILKTGPSVHTH